MNLKCMFIFAVLLAITCFSEGYPDVIGGKLRDGGRTFQLIQSAKPLSKKEIDQACARELEGRLADVENKKVFDFVQDKTPSGAISLTGMTYMKAGNKILKYKSKQQVDFEGEVMPRLNKGSIGISSFGYSSVPADAAWMVAVCEY